MIRDVKNAIVLCGGLGTRLREVIGENQKSMALIQGRPFLDLLIDYLIKEGINHIILATGYKSESIRDYFDKKNYNIKIDYSIEKEPLGTAGAMKNALPYIDSDKVFVLNGDTLFNIDLSRLEENMTIENTDISIAVKDINKITDNKNRYGSINIKDGIITSYNEKNDKIKSDYISGGIYLIKKEMVSSIPDGKVSFENEYMNEVLNSKRRVGAMIYDDEFIDIGTKETYQKINDKNKVIFLDRDGTICDDNGAFNKLVDNYEDVLNSINIYDGVKDSLKILKDKGYMIIVISNQAGVAKGKFKESDIHKFNKILNEKLGGLIDGFYYCIHHDTGKDNDGKSSDKLIKELILDCGCRKPKIGMLIKCRDDMKKGLLQYIDEDIIALDEPYKKDRAIYKKNIIPTDIDIDKSYMIGDKYLDQVCGKNYDLKTIWVKTGEGKIEMDKHKDAKVGRDFDYKAENIKEAIKIILEK